MQFIGAIGAILLALKDQSLIPSNEQITVDSFVGLYVLQKALKAGLYGFRYKHTDSTDKSVERYLYYGSIGLNIAQYIFTVLL